MTACHLVTDGNLTFVSNIYANGLVHAGRKLIAVFTVEGFYLDYDAFFSVRNTKRSVTDLSGLFTEDSS